MTKFSLLALTLTLPLALAPSLSQANALTPEQKAEVESIVKEYILNNGKAIIDSVQTYQTAEQAKADEEMQKNVGVLAEEIKKDKELPFTGKKDAGITIAEFYDYNCGYCKKAWQEVQQLLEKDKDIKLVFIDFPILGPSSLEAAKWALAAQKQGKYFEFHRELMNFQGQKDEASLTKLAKNAGLDLKQLEKDRQDPSIEERLTKNREMAEKVGIQGTPGFMINDKIFHGYISYDAMEGTVKDIREGKTE